jgi:hypothetical protein
MLMMDNNANDDAATQTMETMQMMMTQPQTGDVTTSQKVAGEAMVQ